LRSARTINAGDFLAPGNAAYTIINPSTMRLEASVPAEALSAIRLGAPVEFTVNGYATRQFTGRITSINPVADPSTRQVRVIHPVSPGSAIGSSALTTGSMQQWMRRPGL